MQRGGGGGGAAGDGGDVAALFGGSGGVTRRSVSTGGSGGAVRRGVGAGVVASGVGLGLGAAVAGTGGRQADAASLFGSGGGGTDPFASVGLNASSAGPTQQQHTPSHSQSLSRSHPAHSLTRTTHTAPSPTPGPQRDAASLFASPAQHRSQSASRSLLPTSPPTSPTPQSQPQQGDTLDFFDSFLSPTAPRSSSATPSRSPASAAGSRRQTTTATAADFFEAFGLGGAGGDATATSPSTSPTPSRVSASATSTSPLSPARGTSRTKTASGVPLSTSTPASTPVPASTAGAVGSGTPSAQPKVKKTGDEPARVPAQAALGAKTATTQPSQQSLETQPQTASTTTTTTTAAAAASRVPPSETPVTQPAPTSASSSRSPSAHSQKPTTATTTATSAAYFFDSFTPAATTTAMSAISSPPAKTTPLPTTTAATASASRSTSATPLARPSAAAAVQAQVQAKSPVPKATPLPTGSDFFDAFGASAGPTAASPAVPAATTQAPGRSASRPATTAAAVVDPFAELASTTAGAGAPDPFAKSAPTQRGAPGADVFDSFGSGDGLRTAKATPAATATGGKTSSITTTPAPAVAKTTSPAVPVAKVTSPAASASSGTAAAFFDTFGASTGPSAGVVAVADVVAPVKKASGAEFFDGFGAGANALTVSPAKTITTTTAAAKVTSPAASSVAGADFFDTFGASPAPVVPAVDVVAPVKTSATVPAAKTISPVSAKPTTTTPTAAAKTVSPASGANFFDTFGSPAPTKATSASAHARGGSGVGFFDSFAAGDVGGKEDGRKQEVGAGRSSKAGVEASVGAHVGAGAPKASPVHEQTKGAAAGLFGTAAGAGQSAAGGFFDDVAVTTAQKSGQQAVSAAAKTTSPLSASSGADFFDSFGAGAGGAQQPQASFFDEVAGSPVGGAQKEPAKKVEESVQPAQQYDPVPAAQTAADPAATTTPTDQPYVPLSDPATWVYDATTTMYRDPASGYYYYWDAASATYHSYVWVDAENEQGGEWVYVGVYGAEYAEGGAAGAVDAQGEQGQMPVDGLEAQQGPAAGGDDILAFFDDLANQAAKGGDASTTAAPPAAANGILGVSASAPSGSLLVPPVPGENRAGTPGADALAFLDSILQSVGDGAPGAAAAQVESHGGVEVDGGWVKLDGEVGAVAWTGEQPGATQVPEPELQAPPAVVEEVEEVEVEGGAWGMTQGGAGVQDNTWSDVGWGGPSQVPQDQQVCAAAPQATPADQHSWGVTTQSTPADHHSWGAAAQATPAEEEVHDVDISDPAGSFIQAAPAPPPTAPIGAPSQEALDDELDDLVAGAAKDAAKGAAGAYGLATYADASAGGVQVLAEVVPVDAAAELGSQGYYGQQGAANGYGYGYGYGESGEAVPVHTVDASGAYQEGTFAVPDTGAQVAPETGYGYPYGTQNEGYAVQDTVAEPQAQVSPHTPSSSGQGQWNVPAPANQVVDTMGIVGQRSAAGTPVGYSPYYPGPSPISAVQGYDSRRDSMASASTTAAVADGRVCPSCARKNSGDANFCANCGSRLGEIVAASSPAPPPPSAPSPFPFPSLLDANMRPHSVQETGSRGYLGATGSALSHSFSHPHGAKRTESPSAQPPISASANRTPSAPLYGSMYGQPPGPGLNAYGAGGKKGPSPLKPTMEQPGFNDPLQRHRPRPVISQGFGGKLVVSIPIRQSRYNAAIGSMTEKVYPGSVTIRNVADVVKKSGKNVPEVGEEHKWGGPVLRIKPKNRKKETIKILEERFKSIEEQIRRV
ncbi:hypothetical protein M427DRAFT_456000 [Gonapodya prolifera JEL478]|uniref:Sec16 central conserved domain-containing protein n=1 Tax=Gonapodya prolifera (strain JEL478) TaxID=1344416 RepID=A0A139A2N1_GONPJ|nr:hypothetical protein M427DRAFT_456000 [Gonapodya prolifera JEL478]|eukprot:KXS11022.1 hypothetical protein M427DRAFT_456000 [Gonapodya prolifera JEL478]